ncbi:hypothetical protein FPV67DRAFT_1672206 [Lyophyllum atratum]|nr:hypothetical protein FPV67DRAFT_1672206 [Lyophyllum atratum]
MESSSLPSPTTSRVLSPPLPDDISRRLGLTPLHRQPPPDSETLILTCPRCHPRSLNIGARRIAFHGLPLCPLLRSHGFLITALHYTVLTVITGYGAFSWPFSAPPHGPPPPLPSLSHYRSTPPGSSRHSISSRRSRRSSETPTCGAMRRSSRFAVRQQLNIQRGLPITYYSVTTFLACSVHSVLITDVPTPCKTMFGPILVHDVIQPRIRARCAPL